MANADIASGPFSSSSSPVVEYLQYSPAIRRKGSRQTCASLRVLADTPLPLYADSSVTQAQRSKMAKAVVSDLSSQECTWNSQDRLSALKVIKELSRLSGSGELLAATESLRQIVQITKQESAKSLSAFPSTDSLKAQANATSSASFEALDLLLRILNNVLLQHAQSRQEFASTGMGGMQLALDLIEKHSSVNITFLSARLVFFSTLYEAEITKVAVEKMGLVEIFTRRTQELIQDYITSGVDLALAELQKAFFNVGLYYPRLAKDERNGKAIVGESFHESLLPFLAPTIQLITTYPNQSPTSLTPPLTNAIAVLLNYPVAPYQHIWSKSTQMSRTSTSSEESISTILSSSASKAKRMANSLFGRASPSLLPPHSSKSTNRNITNGSSTCQFLGVLLELLDEFLQRYFTSLDPDDVAPSKLAEKDEIDLQDYAEPALHLCRKLVDEVDDYRKMVKSWLLPADIDRSQGLDKRKDLTGILVRLMASNEYPRLARASGELLLALCDGQAVKMTTEIGYGPCAGFLNTIGQVNALPGAPFTNDEGKFVDPVTGKVLPTVEEMKLQDQAAGLTMTEEEKEAEADRLFTLFDRMDRTGVIKVQNPLKQAVDSGRFQEIEDKTEEEEIKRAQEEDRELETTVEREMKAFRLLQKRDLKGDDAN